MAEIVGTIAASIEIFKTIKKSTELWHDFRGAPAQLKNYENKIENISGALRNTERLCQQISNDKEVSDALVGLYDVLELYEALGMVLRCSKTLRDAHCGLDSSMRQNKFKASLGFALKNKAKLKELDQKLDAVAVPLRDAQTKLLLALTLRKFTAQREFQRSEEKRHKITMDAIVTMGASVQASMQASLQALDHRVTTIADAQVRIVTGATNLKQCVSLSSYDHKLYDQCSEVGFAIEFDDVYRLKQFFLTDSFRPYDTFADGSTLLAYALKQRSMKVAVWLAQGEGKTLLNAQDIQDILSIWTSDRYLTFDSSTDDFLEQLNDLRNMFDKYGDVDDFYTQCGQSKLENHTNTVWQQVLPALMEAGATRKVNLIPEDIRARWALRTTSYTVFESLKGSDLQTSTLLASWSAKNSDVSFLIRNIGMAGNWAEWGSFMSETLSFSNNSPSEEPWGFSPILGIVDQALSEAASSFIYSASGENFSPEGTEDSRHAIHHTLVETLSSRALAWILYLESLQVDLIKYGRSEGLARGLKSESRQERLFNFTYGPSVKDWTFHFVLDGWYAELNDEALCCIDSLRDFDTP